MQLDVNIIHHHRINKKCLNRASVQKEKNYQKVIMDLRTLS